MKVTLETLRQMKKDARPAVGISCYTAPDAVIAAEAGIDWIVVGDSLAMTLLGHDSTLPATMDVMQLFVAATRRGLDSMPDGAHVPLVVGDMPLGSYQPSDRDAIVNACSLIQAGADLVKLEGCMLDRIRALAKAGIGVVAHLGLQPQMKALVGGWRVQGKTRAGAIVLRNEVDAVIRSGAVVVLLEAVPKEVAAWITLNAISPKVPIFGIGCGSRVDGQLLVMSDLIGEFRQFKSRFAKRFGNVGQVKADSVAQYVKATRDGVFPDADTSYAMDPAELKILRDSFKTLRRSVGIKRVSPRLRCFTIAAKMCRVASSSRE